MILLTGKEIRVGIRKFLKPIADTGQSPDFSR
jgi:hypothetical protein